MENISVSKGNKNAFLGEYVGCNEYDSISFKAKSNIKPEHIQKDDRGFYFLDTLEVKLTLYSLGVKINLFQINACDNGKTIELHVATGPNLKLEKYQNTYQAEKEHLLFSQKGEEIKIKFVVYNYKKGKEEDLYILECKNNTHIKIPVYNEIESISEDIQKNKNLDSIPDTRDGNILIGRKP